MSIEIPLVTVAISAWNHERFVEQTLNSTLDSGLPSLEIVICNDASIDATPEIIRQWGAKNADKLDRFKLIEHKTNKGLTVSLNEIISESNGEIIHIICSDDYFLPGGLAEKTRAMLENPQWDAAFSDGQAVGYEGQIYQESMMSTSMLSPDRLTPALMAEELLYNWDMPANLLSMRRRACKIHGGQFIYDPTIFCEDFELAWWATGRHALGFIPSVCTAYRLRSWPQTSNRNPIREHRDIAHVLAKNVRLFHQPVREAMEILSRAHFSIASGDQNAADVFWKIHALNKNKYLERSSQTVAAPLQPQDQGPNHDPLHTEHILLGELAALKSALKTTMKQAAVQSKRIAQQKEHLESAQHLLRYHSASPLRALKLWLNRKSMDATGTKPPTPI